MFDQTNSRGGWKAITQTPGAVVAYAPIAAVEMFVS